MLRDLTERELQVLAQVASGRSNAEISAAMLISVAPVKTHVSRLLAKLHARDRAQLVLLSYELGMTEPCRPGFLSTGRVVGYPLMLAVRH
jgi:DNA-binding NarL/FixJ family response regulator